MTEPEPPEVPEWYEIPRAEAGVNIRPTNSMEGTDQPPFGDLFTEQISKVLGEIRQFFIDWPAHIKAGLDTGIDWLQTVANLELEWLRSLLHKIVDVTASVFDVSSWVAFLDTAIRSAANLVADSFATVFDWIASLLLGAVTFVEQACNLDLTWLRNLIGTATNWSKLNVNLASKDDFIDGVTYGGTTTNPLMGILFGPLFRIFHACQVFGDTVWHAITTFASAPGAPGAWDTMIATFIAAWNTGVDAILSAWGSSKTHEDFVNPATATEAALKNNPVTGWLFGGGSGGNAWLDLFDPVRRFINQMIQGLRLGYFDTDWIWVPSFTTPTTALPGGDPALTPGSNDGDGGAIAPGVDSSIPAAPTGVSAIPWWDVTVSGFPAGGITYAIAAVKAGVEGPATQVTIFVGTLFPPNSNTHVDLRCNVESGVSYRFYRKVDAAYSATAWRQITVTGSGTLLDPWVDRTPRSGGTVASPKTDAELAAQVVTTVQSTAGAAQATAIGAQSTVDSVIDGSIQVSPDTVPDLPGTKIVTPVPPRNLQVLPSGHVSATAPELLYAPHFGASYGVGDVYTTFSDDVCEVQAASGVVQAVWGNAVGCGVGQLLTFMVDIEWQSLVFQARIADAPVRMQVVAYWDGRPVQVLTLASIVPDTADGTVSLRQMVQIGNGVNGIALRMIVGGGATGGVVRYTVPSVRQATRIASEAIQQVDFQIVTSPINNADATAGASVGSAIQESWDTMHAALGGDGGAGKTPADVADLLSIVNQTAVQALANSTANDQAIINITASLSSAIDAITTLQQKVAVLESQAAEPPPPPPPPPPPQPKMEIFSFTEDHPGWIPPVWATTLHMTAVGGGGSSSGGNSAVNLPGSPGKWATNSIAATTVDIFPGKGGVAATLWAGGSPGQASRVVRSGVAVLNASGGAGAGPPQGAYIGQDLTGRGPSPRTYPIAEGYVATGGGNVSEGRNGAIPGGAGAGVRNFLTNKQTNGARGQVWILAVS